MLKQPQDYAQDEYENAPIKDLSIFILYCFSDRASGVYLDSFSEITLDREEAYNYIKESNMWATGYEIIFPRRPENASKVLDRAEVKIVKIDLNIIDKYFKEKK